MKPPFSKNQLIGHLRNLGVEAGCVFMPHTSLKAIRPVAGGAQTVVDALLEAVGPSGTLVMPTFTFSFCRTGIWDRATSPSEMGALTEIVRSLPGAKRSLHPIYSVAAIGPLAEEYGACIDPNGVGNGSPFPLLVRHDAMLGLLGVGYNQGLTLGHHVEWGEHVPYRFDKVFPGSVTDGGFPCPGEYSMLVRDIERGIVTDYRKFGYMLEHAGAVRVGRFGWALARIVLARDTERLARQWLRESVPNLMHRVGFEESESGEKATEVLTL